MAEIDGKVVGKIAFYKGYTVETPPYYSFRLSGAYVKEEYRSLGIGTMLFNEVIKIAKSENVAKIIWSVWEKNFRAVKLYEQMGAKYFTKEDDEQYMFLEVESYESD